MKLKKLDSEHIFLQFLMLFFALISFLLFSFLINEDIWIPEVYTVITTISAIIVLLIGGILLFRVIIKKDKKEIYWAVGFMLVGLIEIVSIILSKTGVIEGCLSVRGNIYTVLFLSSRILLASTFFLVWFLKERKLDKKVNKKEEMAKRTLIVFTIIVFFSFLFLLSWKSIYVRDYCILIFLTIVLMLLTISLIGNVFLKEWEYKDFSFWVIFSLVFLTISELFFFPVLNINQLSLLNLSVLARLFGHTAFLIGVLNNIYVDRLNGKASKNKKVSKKI